MTPAGWILIITSWGVILALLVFCLGRTFRKRT